MIQDDMMALSKAINSGDWFGCEQLLDKVLDQLRLSTSIQICINQCSVFLTTFELYNPQTKWPRKLLILLSDSKPIDYSSEPLNLYDEVVQGPGSDAFISALGLLDSAARKKVDNPERSKSLVATSIIHIISARRFEHWATQHPEDWETWQKTIDIEDDSLAIAIRSKYLKDEDQQQFAKNIWLGLVNELTAMQ